MTLAACQLSLVGRFFDGRWRRDEVPRPNHTSRPAVLIEEDRLPKRLKAGQVIRQVDPVKDQSLGILDHSPGQLQHILHPLPALGEERPPLREEGLVLRQA